MTQTTNYKDLSEPELLKILGSDHMKWAEAFCQMHGGDLGLMQTWFANALMTGYDEGQDAMLDVMGPEKD